MGYVEDGGGDGGVRGCRERERERGGMEGGGCTFLCPRVYTSSPMFHNTLHPSIQEETPSRRTHTHTHTHTQMYTVLREQALQTQAFKNPTAPKVFHIRKDQQKCVFE